jgi:hypothetical protein
MKSIPGYEGLYSAEEDGRIYSHNINDYLITSIWDNYLNVILSKNNKPKKFKVHRLVAITYIPNPENKPQVDHINRIRTDNKVSNLRWATQSENNMNTIAKNKLKEKHIYYHKNKERFKFIIVRNDKRFEKSFKTLEEAIEHRDAYLAQ